MKKLSKNMKTALIFLAVVGVIIFILGFGLGILYEIKTPAFQKIKTAEPTINVLSSKVVQTANAFGEVKNITGNNVTLTYLGDEITMNIANNAQVFLAIPQKDPKTGNLLTGIPIVGKFTDIKIGDQISVTFKIDPLNGQINGNQIYIFRRK